MLKIRYFERLGHKKHILILPELVGTFLKDPKSLITTGRDELTNTDRIIYFKEIM